MTTPNDVLLVETVKIPVTTQESFVNVCHTLYSIGCGSFTGRPELTPDYHHCTNVIGVVVHKTGSLSICLKGEEQYYSERPGVEINESEILKLDTETLKSRMAKHTEDREFFLRAKRLYERLNEKMQNNEFTKEEFEAIEKIIN